jgi:hypothetical protein
MNDTALTAKAQRAQRNDVFKTENNVYWLETRKASLCGLCDFAVEVVSCR